jgi:hypothetical protein
MGPQRLNLGLFKHDDKYIPKLEQLISLGVFIITDYSGKLGWILLDLLMIFNKSDSINCYGTV